MYSPYQQSVLNFGQGLSSAVKIIITVTVSVFIIEQLLGAEREFNMYLGLVPTSLWGNFYFWQPFTYMFLHGGFWHIFVNMIVLWMFGSEIERYWGRREFIAYYFITGIGSGILTAIFSYNSAIPVVGASGAIYGVLLAYGMMFPNRIVLLYFLIPVKVKYLVMFLGGVAFYSSLTDTGSTVSNLTHLSGMVIGFLYMKSNVKITNLGDSFGELRIKREVKKAERVKKSFDNMKNEIDELLDRINEVGYENLTDEEKSRLEEASRHMSKDRKNMS